MSNLGGPIGRVYPLCFAFGNKPRILSPEEMASAPFEQRIESVWPYVVKRAIRFRGSLRPREQANFDPEDIIGELWISLRERDLKWEPARGSYITYVGAIVDREFSSIRDRSRTIESPRNSVCRLKAYSAEEKAGTLTARRAKTFNDIRRTLDDHGSVDDRDASVVERPDDLAASEEANNLATDAVTQGIRSLSIVEARVIGETCGLWGREARSSAGTARLLGISPREVRRTKAGAISKIRERLIAMGHPAVASDN